MSILNMILAQVTPADTLVQQAADTLQQAMDSAAQVVTVLLPSRPPPHLLPPSLLSRNSRYGI